MKRLSALVAVVFISGACVGERSGRVPMGSPRLDSAAAWCDESRSAVCVGATVEIPLPVGIGADGRRSPIPEACLLVSSASCDALHILSLDPMPSAGRQSILGFADLHSWPRDAHAQATLLSLLLANVESQLELAERAWRVSLRPDVDRAFSTLACCGGAVRLGVGGPVRVGQLLLDGRGFSVISGGFSDESDSPTHTRWTVPDLRLDGSRIERLELSLLPAATNTYYMTARQALGRTTAVVSDALLAAGGAALLAFVAVLFYFFRLRSRRSREQAGASSSERDVESHAQSGQDLTNAVCELRVEIERMHASLSLLPQQLDSHGDRISQIVMQLLSGEALKSGPLPTRPPQSSDAQEVVEALRGLVRLAQRVRTELNSVVTLAREADPKIRARHEKAMRGVTRAALLDAALVEWLSGGVVDDAVLRLAAADEDWLQKGAIKAYGRRWLEEKLPALQILIEAFPFEADEPARAQAQQALERVATQFTTPGAPNGALPEILHFMASRLATSLDLKYLPVFCYRDTTDSESARALAPEDLLRGADLSDRLAEHGVIPFTILTVLKPILSGADKQYSGRLEYYEPHKTTGRR